MNTIDYEHIEPLVDHVDHNRSSLDITFTCSHTGKSVRSRVPLGQNLETSKARSGIVMIAYFILRRWIFNLIGLRGFGARYTAARLTSRATRGARNKLRISNAQRRQAILDGFRRVRDQFTWEESAGQWVHHSFQRGTR